MSLFDVFKKTANNEERAISVPTGQSKGLVENAEAMLAEVHVDLSKVDAVELPLAQLGALGGGIASMLPALRTVTSTISQTNPDLYRCIFPKGITGYLAKAHNDGMNIGTIMNKKGIAGQARWVKASTQTKTVSSTAPINPATLMMAGAIMAIEKKLDDVVDMEKQIISFLEEDKQSKIEGDLKTLTTIIKEYKYNWDDDIYTATHHQLAADIKREAEANMIFYQKQVADALKASPTLFMQQFVNSKQDALVKQFRYYRLSLYLYGFASFIEVMLQGRYEEGYIQQVRQSIIDRTETYQETYTVCQKRLEALTASTVEHHLLKGLGAAGKAVGSLVGSIPGAKDGQVSEWLIENGMNLEQNGENYGKKALKQFESIRDSGSSLFTENLVRLNRLFNQTQEIYIGHDSVYLVKEAIG